MIKAACTADGKHIIKTARAAHGLGPRLEADWHILQENPAVPYRFYMADGDAVLQLCGGRAVLCGDVHNSEEMEALFALEQPCAIISTGWVPQGWQKTNLQVMVFDGRSAEIQHPNASASVFASPPLLSLPLPDGFEENVSVSEFINALTATAPFENSAGRDAFYSDMCTRRNHGRAFFCGVRQGGKLAGVAAVFSLTDTEAYISGIATLPEHRGKGYASALTAHLCGRFGGKAACGKKNTRAISLICENSLAGFYTRLGFKKAGTVVQAQPTAAQHFKNNK